MFELNFVGSITAVNVSQFSVNVMIRLKDTIETSEHSETLHFRQNSQKFWDLEHAFRTGRTEIEFHATLKQLWKDVDKIDLI